MGHYRSTTMKVGIIADIDPWIVGFGFGYRFSL